MQSQRNYKLSDLIHNLDVTLNGDPNCLIQGVAVIQNALPGSITFLTNTRYKKYLKNTQASAVIVSKQDAEECATNVIISENPYYTYAHIAEFFRPKFNKSVGIHPSVVQGRECLIAASASVSPNCVLGDRVIIGEHVVIGPNCVIADDVEIGDHTCLVANITLYHQVKIGQRVQIAAGVVIGCDGFGFANSKGSWRAVPQLGTVIIEDDVNIGANTTIDRGAVEATIIEKGVILDNLIQVGHNVRIGENTAIAGCVGIAGSTDIGKNCMIGGAACFAGHLSVADNVMITGMTSVTKSITEPGIYSSGVIGAVPNHEFRKNNARFNRLASLMDRVKTLEASLKTLMQEKEKIS